MPLEAAGETAVAADPSDGALDDPALRQHDELGQLGLRDDFEVHLAAGSEQPSLEFCPWLPLPAKGFSENGQTQRGEHVALFRCRELATMLLSRVESYGDPDPSSAGTAGDAARWGGSMTVVGMAARTRWSPPGRPS